ncbi:MAG TPA: AAA family ATPase [Solirubrobacteraceae bacterium]
MTLQTAALLEREAELAALDELCARALAGHGGLLLFEAAPGLGKSALLGEAVARGRAAGLTVVRARGHELERAFAWGVARALLEPLLAAHGDAGLLAGPAAPARAVFEPVVEPGGQSGDDVGFAIAHALHWLTLRLAAREPLLLVVDDAHWADEPSLRFLVYLLGRLAEHPVALLVAARPHAGGLLEQLAADPAAVVRVPAPLGAEGVASLVRRRLGEADDAFCARVLDLTAGNPLQVRELLLAVDRVDAAGLEAAAEQAARSLGRSVLRRLAALSPEARALAGAVAVFEDDAPLRLAAALVGLGPVAALEAADALERADVLRAGDPLGFTHPLLRAAIYGRLAFGERARMHRRAARLLGESGAPDEQVSAHLLKTPASGRAEVVDVLRAAARRAFAQGVPASAVDYLSRALREPPAPELRAEVLAELGRAEVAAGRPEAAAHLGAAVELVGEPRARAALLLEFGRVLHHAGRLPEATAALRRGLDEVREGDDLAVDLEGAYLGAAMHTPAGAAEAHRRREAILAGALPASRTGRALASKAMILRLLAGAPRERTLEVARELYGAGRLVEESGADTQALTYVIGALSWCDDYRTADDALRLTFAAAERRGSVLTLALACQLRGRQRLWTGPLTDAVADGRTAVGVWREAHQVYLHPSSWSLVSALLERDEPAEAEAVLALGDGQRASSGFFAAWRHCATGRVLAARGGSESALDAYLAAGRGLGELAMHNPSMLAWRSEAGLVARRLGREELARELVLEEVALAERFGALRAVGVARRAAGLLERGEAAVSLLHDAVGVLARSGARVERARALVDLGAAVRRAGRPLEARETLREALSAADAVGALALARRAREELRLAGGRARAAAATPGDRLTPGERRVAELAASGSTNREIAGALFITVKAVEWHLGNSYRKLDIRGRGQLAGAL